MMIGTRTEREPKGKALASGLLLLALMAACLLLTARPAHAETFAVNSTGDAGDQSRGNGFCNTAPFQVGTEPECTLRAAIEEANVTTAADTISFNIGGSGVKTISPASELPRITEAVTIDGYSEPGASPNTLDTGTDAALKIELSGANAGVGAAGLRITGPDSVVKGLIINRFSYGVIIISDTGFSTAGNNKIEGNYIGTDASGTQDLGNFYRGVYIDDASRNTIGGTTAGARNIISGNDDDGVAIFGDARGVTLVSNSIFSNGALGIDLLNDNVPNLNDPDDADGGPNNMQNYPVITSAKAVTVTVKKKKKKGKKKKRRTVVVAIDVAGNLNSRPGQSYTLQFFSNPTADPSGFGEGKTFLGQKSVTTDTTGNATFSTRLTPVGGAITATATNDSTGDTSEFSAAKAVG